MVIGVSSDLKTRAHKPDYIEDDNLLDDTLILFIFSNGRPWN